ncbi:AAA family ATPase [Streptomyces sp. NBC_01298]|uniref:AAA family ATPase n=1 Tax=Streptomyces sp. NBC_01298 TaxID=2903817 RepID=UPI002E1446AB|nr:AAA family ATPase [Streptomyces sp. NBC_01298]
MVGPRGAEAQGLAALWEEGFDGVLVPDVRSPDGHRTGYVLHLARLEEPVGAVRIAHAAMDPRGRRMPPVPDRFVRLDDDFFSVGQDVSYYENLRHLPDRERAEVLRALRDMASDEAVLTTALEYDVTRDSLLRYVKLATVRGQMRRLAGGGARRQSFGIGYTPPGRDGTNPPRFTFAAVPGSQPPTNIHALTGRNGVGKSFVLSRLARAVAADEPDPARFGLVTEEGRQGRSFANLVMVSFSAFDGFPLLHGDAMFDTSYVGLHVPGSAPPRFKTPNQLRRDFTNAVRACMTRERTPRWIDAMRTLDYNGGGLLEDGWLDAFESTPTVAGQIRKARALFGKLSAGHRIVILTVTRLIENVDERTLVIIDEPETHLHPPLLAAFMRTVSALLADRNGLAIVATHSPVVTQELPARCVWKLQRHGDHLRARPPGIETWGENVGVLTHEVFTLEVTESGFLKDLRTLVNQEMTYDQVLARYNHRMGSEARVALSALIAVRDGETRHEGPRDAP